MKAAILTSVYLDYDGKEQRIGGVEVYLHSLAQVVQEQGALAEKIVNEFQQCIGSDTTCSMGDLSHTTV